MVPGLLPLFSVSFQQAAEEPFEATTDITRSQILISEDGRGEKTPRGNGDTDKEDESANSVCLRDNKQQQPEETEHEKKDLNGHENMHSSRVNRDTFVC